MGRLARAVVPGMPHHVTQRGNRRMRTLSGHDESWQAGGYARGKSIWEYLEQAEVSALGETLRRHERTGRPLGEESFVRKLGVLMGRDLLGHKNAETGETLKVVQRVVDAVGKVIHEDVKFVKP